MAIPTFEHDFKALPARSGGMLAAIKAHGVQTLRALGPRGRRYALTGFGALVALGFGVAAASAVRLPADMKGDAGAPDQATVLTQLPSEAAARAAALDNPPAYAVSQPREADPTPQIEAALSNAAEDAAAPADDAGTDDAATDGKDRAAVAPAPAADRADATP